MHDIYIKEKISGPVRYQSFFTDAEEINSLMIALLGDASGCKILEPCAGQGAFIKPLVCSANRIDAIDIDSEHVSMLMELNLSVLRVQEADFIDHFVNGASSASIDNDYDAVICNPPYGLKFSVTYRKRIKARHPDVYARESYGLFLTFGVRCLREGGRFVFIVPDTFLTSRNHRPLREFLIENVSITHMVQFNSSRFETVNFGYGSLCIIAGYRSKRGQLGDAKWLDYRQTEDKLSIQSFQNSPIVAATLLKEKAEEGWTQCGGETQIFRSGTRLLGEIAECRTGIYTGDNPRFCAFDKDNPPPRVNGHPIQWSQVRTVDTLSNVEREHGVEDLVKYVPFIRGGHRSPFEETKSAIDWSRSAVDYYRTDKKARLQNSQFYFRAGLAVPMVTSGRLSASYIEGAVFDQGVVGIFPEQKEMLDFILVFLNSEHATKLKKQINPSANNSANYLKRLKVPIPNAEKMRQASQICDKWRNLKSPQKEVVRKQATDFIDENFSPA